MVELFRERKFFSSTLTPLSANIPLPSITVELCFLLRQNSVHKSIYGTLHTFGGESFSYVSPWMVAAYATGHWHHTNLPGDNKRERAQGQQQQQQQHHRQED